MQFGVIYLKTQNTTQPHVTCWTLNFVLVALFWWNTHGIQLPSLPRASVYCVLCQVFLVDWWMELVLASWRELRGTLPIFCIQSLRNVNLNSQCDNFEAQQVGFIMLLRMVNSRRCTKSFFVHFKGHLLTE